jgi:serine/threonine-protein kinase
MSLEPRPTSSPPDTLTRHRDQVCDRFEAAWQAGTRPCIEDYLAAIPQAQRPGLLRELILLEVDYRRLAGEQPRAEEFLARFPTLDSAWIASVSIIPPANQDNLPPLAQCPAAAPAPGVVLGDYELLEEIARGGMGVVFRARQKGVERVVALKVILHGQLATLADVLRFRTEAEHAAALDHPHIVPIYHVGHDNGRPFFTMRLVEGGNLAQALTDPARAQAGWRWLARAEGGQWAVGEGCSQQDAACLLETVARAVHHAHQRGVIHRDLKSANILLDGAGEPHVTDFGLAKRVASPSGHTQSGALVGTPSYMAPEQAMGQKDLTTAADVYALGAILYELLVGRLPFRQSTVLDTLRQVVEVEPERPRQHNPRVHEDLETICLKCLQKAPAKRYASAEALAEDLRRFQAGEPIAARPVGRLERVWKLAKRRPAVAALTGGLVLVVLVGFGLVTWKWQEELAARAAAELKEREAEAARMHAEANEKKATLARQEADFEKQQAEHQRDLALMYFGKAQDAVQKMLTEVSLDHALLRNEPRFELVRKNLLVKALQFHQEFLNEKSADPTVRLATGIAYRHVADIHAELGNREEAEKAYRQSVKLLTQVKEQFPGKAVHRQQLAMSCNNLGVFLRAGDQQEAAELFQQAMDLRGQLVKDFPGVPSYRQELAASCINLAVLLKDKSKLPQAELLYGQAGKLLEQLVKEVPTQPSYRQDLARLYNNLALLVQSNNRLKEAEDLHRQALELRDKLVKAFPGVASFREDLASSCVNLGSLLMKGQRDEAVVLFGQAKELLAGLSTDFPRIVTYREDLARSCYLLAFVLHAAGKRQQAESPYWKAYDLYHGLSVENPSVASYRHDLARSCYQLGLLLEALSRDKEAEPLYREGIRLLQQLAKETPAAVVYRKEQAELWIRVASVLEKSQRWREAEVAYRHAIWLRAQLAYDDPTQVSLVETTANTVWSLARMHQNLKHWKQACAVYERTIQWCLRAPCSAVASHTLLLSYVGLTDSQVALGNHQGAALTAGKLGKHTEAGRKGLVLAGRYLALCVTLSLKDKELTDAQRRQVGQAYGDQAIAFLRQAIELGWSDVGLLKTDFLLASIRDRKDFQDLIRQLEDKKLPGKNPA